MHLSRRTATIIAMILISLFVGGPAAALSPPDDAIDEGDATDEASTRSPGERSTIDRGFERESPLRDPGLSQSSGSVWCALGTVGAIFAALMLVAFLGGMVGTDDESSTQGRTD